MKSRSKPEHQFTAITNADVLTARGPKNDVDVTRPYLMFVESEYSANGRVEDTATIFLTNRECPFRCVMCDLWKNTTDDRVPVGAIPEQIRHALKHLPAAQHVKLYNSGNFFDPQAIPPEDLRDISRLVNGFETVIVENHPKLCSDHCIQFRDQCQTHLEIAMGLETSDESTLQLLNKGMTTGDFAQACEFLSSNDISIRTFVLLRPPGLSEVDGIRQAKDSIQFAFDCGAECCAVIPTRTGNGIMDRLYQNGQFHPPELRSLELVQEFGLQLGHGRVFADVWDAEQFSTCEHCVNERIIRLKTMNLTQTIPPPIDCDYCLTDDQ